MISIALRYVTSQQVQVEVGFLDRKSADVDVRPKIKILPLYIRRTEFSARPFDAANDEKQKRLRLYRYGISLRGRFRLV